MMPTKKENKGITKKNLQTSIDNIPEEISDVLNEKQKAFCREYVYDWNGTRAYKYVYSVSSDEVAGAAAPRLLGNVRVKEYLNYLKNNLAELSGISPLMIINEHKKIAFSSIAHLHLTWIERKDFELLTDEQKACISEIDTKTVRKVQWEYDEELEKKIPIDYDVEYIRIRLYNKQISLDSISKMIGADGVSKVQVTNPDGSMSPKIILQTIGTEIPILEKNKEDE